MTNQQHPVSAPLELKQRLYGLPQMKAIEMAFQSGADAELEACCEWIADWYGNGCNEVIGHLRSARRPKPSSLKEQALIEFDSLLGDSEHEGAAIIRHALEQLPDPS